MAGRRLILFLAFVSFIVLMAGVGGGQVSNWENPVEAAELMGIEEIGENDFPISQMGTAAEFRNVNPAVAYNVNDDQYLAVWAENDPLNGQTSIVRISGRLLDSSGQPLGPDFPIVDANGGLDDDPNVAVVYNQVDNKYLVAWGDTLPATNEREILGMQVGNDGTPIGNKRTLTLHGTPGQTTARTYNPKLVHNALDNEYLLVYQGDNASGAAINEYEIFYVRLDGATVNRLSSGRISDMGPDGSGSYDARTPDVTFNPVSKEYLVVWSADSDGSDDGVVNDEFEIFGQRLTQIGLEIGGNDFRISDMGPNGDDDFDAFVPNVTFNNSTSQFLVVWRGDDTIGAAGDEDEIYGQLLTADGQPAGSNDFRISHMGPDGDQNFDAANPVVAYNPNNNQFMVAWQADDNSGGVVDGEVEIFGRMVSASGQPAGSTQVRLSQMGVDGDITFSGTLPGMVYNTTANEFFVVWQGYDDGELVFDSQAAVFSQRLNGANGQETGEDDALVSDFQEILTLFRAGAQDVAFNSAENEYLLVWMADDNGDGMVDEEFEIFGQIVDAVSGQNIGPRIRLSDAGPTGDAEYDARNPVVAYNSADNEYLVVWSANDVSFGDINDEEIFGQRLSADGVEIGTNDFRISDMGPEGVDFYPARNPNVVFNPVDNEYLIVWAGDNTISGPGSEFEIFGQRLSVTGAQIGVNDFRISNMGPDGDTNFRADGPALTYNSIDNQYLVVWRGKDTFNGNDLEFEIFGQRLSAAGVEIGANDFRLSDMGPDGDNLYSGESPDIVHNPTNNQYLVVWHGFDNIPQVFGKKVFGQRLDAAGNEIGVNDFPISVALPTVTNWAEYPTVVIDPQAGDYTIAWEGYDESLGIVAFETEILARQVDANGVVIGDNDIRLSDMGPDGDIDFDARFPTLAYNTLANEYLVTWSGNDILPNISQDEVFGQRFIPLSSPPPTPTATSTGSPTPPGPTPTVTSTPPVTPTPNPFPLHKNYLPMVVKNG